MWLDSTLLALEKFKVTISLICENFANSIAVYVKAQSEKVIFYNKAVCLYFLFIYLFCKHKYIQ